MTLSLYGKSRKRQGLLGLLAVLTVTFATIAAMNIQPAQAADPVPSSMQLTQWKTSPTGWTPGALNAQNSSYAEGDSVPFQIDFGSLDSGQYEVTICRDFIDGSGNYGYIDITPYNIDNLTPAPSVTGTPVNSGPFTGINMSFDLVTDTDTQGACGSGARATVVEFTAGSGTQYLYWGGRIAAFEDDIPGDGTVPAGDSAGNWSGASLHMKTIPSKDAPLQVGGLVGSPSDLTVVKTNSVSGTGTFNVAFDWTITISNDDGTTVEFANNDIVFEDIFPPNITVNSITENEARLSCSVAATGPDKVECESTGPGLDIASGASIVIVINVTPISSGTFDNGTGPSVCVVDPDDEIEESVENNNTCADTVSTTTGKITIVKVSTPSDVQDFSFNLSSATQPNNPFSLDDDNGADGTLIDTKVFDNLPPGQYDVTEGATAGWTLASPVSCVPAANTTPITDGAQIDLAAGDDITCTFTNTKDASGAVRSSRSARSSTTTAIPTVMTAASSSSTSAIRRTLALATRRILS